MYKGQSYPFSAYVVRGYNVNNLLSQTLSADMNLVRRVEEANRVASEHYDAFGEHGTLKTDPVKIQLKDSALPCAVHTARCVPIPMLQKVKEELQRMEKNGVIEWVTQPTEWCSPMVPALKKKHTFAWISKD